MQAAYKKERQRKKESKRERSKQISQKKIQKSKFWLLHVTVKNKKAVSLHQISRKMCLSSCKLILAIIMLIKAKTSPKESNW